MVYAKKIEETKLRKMNRDGKRDRPEEPNKKKSNKRFYNKDYPMVIKDRESNKNSQGRSGGGSTFERS